MTNKNTKSTRLKTTNIKGKDYVEVHERIRYFRESEAFEGWSLISKWLKLDTRVAICEAVIEDTNGRQIACGTAMELADSSFINKTSHIENCETSAWGRALGNLGIGIENSVASAIEVANAINNQNKKTPNLGEIPKHQLPYQNADDVETNGSVGSGEYPTIREVNLAVAQLRAKGVVVDERMQRTLETMDRQKLLEKIKTHKEDRKAPNPTAKHASFRMDEPNQNDIPF